MEDEAIELEHHKQRELCTTRPPYRQGRKLTAIKTYTINNESVYLLIFGVPKINLRNELKTECKKFGALTSLVLTSGHKTEQFTECFMAKYDRIQSARTAKRKLDARNFFGGLLHVCYAPEMEDVNETRHKLDQRRFEINRQLIKYELSKKSIVDILKNNTKLTSSVPEVGGVDSFIPDMNHFNNSSSIDLSYSKSVTEINHLNVKCLPDSLPLVNIHSHYNSSTFNRQSSSGNSTNFSNCKGISEELKMAGNEFNSNNNSNLNSNVCELSQESEKKVDDRKEYVFKRKRKKKLKKVGGDFLNSVVILKDTGNRDAPVVDAVEDFGKVTVYNAEAVPRIVKLPNKPVNKIVFNIKNDKRL